VSATSYLKNGTNNENRTRGIETMYKKIFKEIENKFNMEHACDCEKWCSCWEDFKEKWKKKQI